MKRPVLHSIFWTLFLLQDMLLHLTWFSPNQTGISDQQPLWVAFQASIILLVPKVLIVYYFLNRGLPGILNKQLNQARVLAEVVLVLVFSILLYHFSFNTIIYQHIYQHTAGRPPLFTIRSLVVAIMEIGFVTGVAVAIRLTRLQLTGKQREMNLIREKLETELKFLRNQTNPHFLMNTLTNIYVLARKQSRDTAEVVMKLSDVLRFMLYESDGEFITLADEIKVIEGYLDLETIRYDQRLSVSFEKEIDRDSYRIAPLLLLPFVENAFKHGVSEARFESFIHIEIKTINGQLHFSVENTAENNHIPVQKNNIGLNNVRRQLELTYKDFRLEISNEENIFRASLFINLFSNVEI